MVDIRLRKFMVFIGSYPRRFTSFLTKWMWVDGFFMKDQYSRPR